MEEKVELERYEPIGDFMAGDLCIRVCNQVGAPRKLLAMLYLPIRAKEDGTLEYLSVGLDPAQLALLGVLCTKASQSMVTNTVAPQEGKSDAT